MTMSNRKEINERLSSIDIRGKGYITVDQRILGFWEVYESGRIVTEKLSDDCSRCDFIARVYDGEQLISTGHAFEERKGNINSTSYVENCETSAIGRALGILGIGVIGSIASADEVLLAQKQQEKSHLDKKPSGVSEEARHELAEACKAYAKFTGSEFKEVMESVAIRHDFKKTDECYLRIANELFSESQ